MIRISQIRLPCGSAPEALESKIRKTLKLELRSLSLQPFAQAEQFRAPGSAKNTFYRIARHSVDARKKPQLFDIYTVDVETGLSRREETALLRRLRNRNVDTTPPDPYRFPSPGPEPLEERPVIIGAGPAGLFCALFLAEHGYRPLLIERGKRMEERAVDVERFWRTGVLDPGSNVQFGEGGAGTFSDGKLNTQINDKTGRSGQVLRIFANAGAPESILYEAKPHIGTDRLRAVIPAIRKRIEAAGGEVLFETICTGLVLSDEESGSGQSAQDSAGQWNAGNEVSELGESAHFEPGNKSTGDDFSGCGDSAHDDSGQRNAGNEISACGESRGSGSGNEEFPSPDCAPVPRKLCGINIRSARDPDAPQVFLPAQAVVLAIGHSARDTIAELLREGIPMEQKPFAIGFRVAHPQPLIDLSQYGFSNPEKLLSMRLSASPYKLTAKASSGRGVYSFCMCPGGYIVNASSEPGHLCVNGMSDEGRDSGWANSAVVITVGEKEFGSRDTLAGLRFQRALERRARELGKGKIPVQMYTTFRDIFRAASPEDNRRDMTNDNRSGFTADTRSGFPEEKKTDPEEKSAIEPERTVETSSGSAIPDFRAKGAWTPAPLHTLLPEDLTADFIEGMEQFGKKIAGFNGAQAVVAGIESRTSSPVRIPRGVTLESIGAAGLYPCGEGAGYAGGIMSAAMDGIRAAEAIARKYHLIDH
ncbi:MAG: NAD(P)-binding protein [Eubacteriales bacterium]|nr:NAD(P)-binding protein [Eubacteriales bacterium]